MKVTITIEQFDNGISLKWKNPKEGILTRVALDSQKETEIGRMIWNGVKQVMDEHSCNIVDVNLEYSVEV